MSEHSRRRRTLSRGSTSSRSPRDQSPPSLTYHPTILPLPTPSLVESVAGAAHYSGTKIESETPLKHRQDSHEAPDDHTQLKPGHQRALNDLRELYGGRPTLEILERSWHEDAEFEDPLTICKGYSQYAAQWYAMSKLFSESKTLESRVMSSTISPNRLVFWQSQQYTTRFLKRQMIINSIIIVDFDEEGKILRMVDQWQGNDLPTRIWTHFLRQLRRMLAFRHIPRTPVRALIGRLPALHQELWTRALHASTGDRETNTPSPAAQSSSPLAPIGVSAAMQAARDPDVTPRPKIFDEFSLKDRVGIVSGGNRGLGLEMALVLCELGARAVYCFDLPVQPGDEWTCTREYVRRMGNGSRLEYVSADVRDQRGMWTKAQEIGDKEGRMDVCIAAAGITKPHFDCLEYPENELQEVMDINTNGALFTAQAAGRQMVRFGSSGSIILIASIAAHATLKGEKITAYNASKAAVLQMARSMACELAPKGIRVNTISPGFILTPMTIPQFARAPETLKRWSDLNPVGRIGRPDELRGAAAWLASDASSFCTGSDIFVSGGYQAW
ncbi:putative NAD-binding protein [Lyophyllum shimeji]|uniref:NAD-binding protein n=1 Tax=Lyophyllum shimeji TaxID=47721 RepID=A0A9P3UID4_LYOSH|nr:putative NAD-binding protein [Lyophyllum shimeji]